MREKEKKATIGLGIHQPRVAGGCGWKTGARIMHEGGNDAQLLLFTSSERGSQVMATTLPSPY